MNNDRLFFNHLGLVWTSRKIKLDSDCGHARKEKIDAWTMDAKLDDANYEWILTNNEDHDVKFYIVKYNNDIKAYDAHTKFSFFFQIQ